MNGRRYNTYAQVQRANKRYKMSEERKKQAAYLERVRKEVIAYQDVVLLITHGLLQRKKKK